MLEYYTFIVFTREKSPNTREKTFLHNFQVFGCIYRLITSDKLANASTWEGSSDHDSTSTMLDCSGNTVRVKSFIGTVLCNVREHQRTIRQFHHSRWPYQTILHQDYHTPEWKCSLSLMFFLDRSGLLAYFFEEKPYCDCLLLIIANGPSWNLVTTGSDDLLCQVLMDLILSVNSKFETPVIFFGGHLWSSRPPLPLNGPCGLELQTNFLYCRQWHWYFLTSQQLMDVSIYNATLAQTNDAAFDLSIAVILAFHLGHIAFVSIGWMTY